MANTTRDTKKHDLFHYPSFERIPTLGADIDEARPGDFFQSCGHCDPHLPPILGLAAIRTSNPGAERFKRGGDLNREA
jgi:hypothetical protein